MNPSSSNPPPHRNPGWRWLLITLLTALVVLGVFGSTYLAGREPQHARRRRTYSVSIAPTPTIVLPVPYFAAVEPGLETALLNERDADIGIAVPGIPPVGIYLPRTGLTQFQFPTPTPRPSPIPSATPTALPTFTPTSYFEFLTQTPLFMSPTQFRATMVAQADQECAPSGLPAEGVLTQRFHRWHSGIDIGIHLNTPILATHSGKVTFAGWSEIGYGYLVIVQSGMFSTYYAHLSSFGVSQGDIVTRGMILAWSGSTGNSTGPHLHYEIRINDVPVDPLTFEQRGYRSC